jgi:peroxiredoxin
LPRLVELNERFKDRGVAVVSINQGKRVKAAEEFLNTHKVAHTVLADLSGSVFDAYRVRAIPVTVIIDKNGRVAFRHVGFSQGDEEKLAREVESLL